PGAAAQRGPGADPDAADRPGLGRRLRGRHQDAGRAHQAAPRQDRARPGQAAAHRHRARSWLQVRVSGLSRGYLPRSLKKIEAERGCGARPGHPPDELLALAVAVAEPVAPPTLLEAVPDAPGCAPVLAGLGLADGAAFGLAGGE